MTKGAYTPSDNAKLVYAYMAKRLPEDQFFRDFGTSKEKIHQEILDLLQRGLIESDPDPIEQAIPLAYRFGISRDYLEPFNRLALEPWHFRHEDIVFAVGKLKDPSSIPVLTRTAIVQHPYLEDDEFFALGSKSIYAMENIGTLEAVQVIVAFSNSPNGVLRTTARKRLQSLSEPLEQSPISEILRNAKDRIESLRQYALTLSRSGKTRREVYLHFLAFHDALQVSGREADVEVLGDVMDMITNTYSPFNLNLPE